MAMVTVTRPCRAKVLRSLTLAAILALVGAVPARAVDNLSIIYGLGEYAEYNDNLFNSNKGQVKDTAINTAPDLSILYDDGKTRWLGRGSYRRESFPDNRALSGDYFATSGEFSRELTDRLTFSLLGGYTRQSSVQLGNTLSEPGQLQVIVPTRGAGATGTFWSPELTVFWSKRFRSSLSYSDTQSFSSGGTNLMNRSLMFASAYAFSPRTMGQIVVAGSMNRNSGFAFAEQNDTNGFVARVGLSRVFSRKFTVDLSLGPQWTDQIELPDRVTLLKKIRWFDQLFGPSDEELPLKQPHTKVDTISLSSAFSLTLNYQWDTNTRLSLAADRSTTSGQGATGTQQQDSVRVTLDRALGQRWRLGLSGGFTRTRSISNQFAILLSKDPVTGERLAQDRRTFDTPLSLDLRQISFQPRIDFRINRYWNAYGTWQFVDYDQTGKNGTRYQLNRVTVGLEYRREERY